MESICYNAYSHFYKKKNRTGKMAIWKLFETEKKTHSIPSEYIYNVSKSLNDQSNTCKIQLLNCVVTKNE